MKLNNKGWGYRQMLLMTCILLVFLMIAAYNIYALYNDLDAKDAVTYVNLENKLQIAASKYVGDKNLESSNLIISLTDLKNEEYITVFNDDSNRVCNGYVVYENYKYSPYISCPDYISNNYNIFNE